MPNPVIVRRLLASGGAMTSLFNGLVAYWPLNDASNGARLDVYAGNNLKDQNGNLAATTGVIDSAVQFTASIASNALPLNSGSTTFLQAGAGKSFSFSMWIKGGATVNAPFFGKWGTSPNGFVFWDSAGTLTWTGAENGTLTSRNVAVMAPDPANFHHIFLAYDTSSQLLLAQVDAGTRLTGACADVNADTNIFTVGNYSTLSIPEQGTMCELAAWNRVLSLAEVNALYNGGRGNRFVTH